MEKDLKKHIFFHETSINPHFITLFTKGVIVQVLYIYDSSITLTLLLSGGTLLSLL
jgi:hypothetical protein